MLSDAKKVVKFQVDKNTKYLFKRMFTIFEDLYEDHELMMSKIVTLIPEDKLAEFNMTDYFTPERLQYIRKKILDAGNDTLRENENVFEQVEMEFVKKVVDKN